MQHTVTFVIEAIGEYGKVLTDEEARAEGEALVAAMNENSESMRYSLRDVVAIPDEDVAPVS